MVGVDECMRRLRCVCIYRKAAFLFTQLSALAGKQVCCSDVHLCICEHHNNLAAAFEPFATASINSCKDLILYSGAPIRKKLAGNEQFGPNSVLQGHL